MENCKKGQSEGINERLFELLAGKKVLRGCVLPPGENLAEVWIWSKFHEG